MTEITRLKKIAAELLELIPTGLSVELTAHRDRNTTEVRVHRVESYGIGTALLRSFEIGVREKHVFDPESPWTSLDGEKDGVHFIVFCAGLPSSCKIVKVTEKIPRRQTIDTGEFIQIERTKIECGSEAV